MNWQALREKALIDTKKNLRESVNDDNLITQTMAAVEELDKVSNILAKRLREWFELTAPEVSKRIGDNEAFTRVVLEKTRDELLAEIEETNSMGALLAESDQMALLTLAESIKQLQDERGILEKYLDTLMRRHCPNMTAVSGVTIGARLLKDAGSLRKLAFIQASTIQLYGAEKALFRHIKSGAKPPKHGHIINHPLVAKAKEKGKVARVLADKISIAAKVDYFKGEPIGEHLRAELEKKFGVETE